MTEFADETFLYWAKAREDVRLRRKSGVPRAAWTDDPILKAYRFCNVSREHDAGTLYIDQCIRKPYDAIADEDDLFLAVCLARFFNLPDALEVLWRNGLLNPARTLRDDLHGIYDTLTDHHENGGRAFSPAYMVGCHNNAATFKFGKGKIAFVCGVLDNAKMPKAKTRQGFVEDLASQYGFGEFMAGQVAADLAYTRLLADAPDHKTWAPRGPGAMRGMNIALGRPANTNIPTEEYLRVGRAQFDLVQKALPHLDLSLHDVASNVNCESFKYCKLRDTGVAPKRKFK